MARFKPYTCAGCGKGSNQSKGACLAFGGSRWHQSCFKKATPAEREKARAAVLADPESIVTPRRE